MNYILLALTILPLLGCVLVSAIENRSARNVVVIAFSAIIMAMGAYFGFRFILSGSAAFSLTQNTFTIEKIALGIFGIEVLLLAYIIWRGVTAKRWTSPILAVIQFVTLCYFEFGLHPHFGVDFISVDSLSVILMLLVSIIGPLILIFAIGYMKEHEDHLHLVKTKQPQFFGIIFFFLFAMNALAMSNNLSWLCCFWEMTTLCSFLLIQHDKTEESIGNAFRTLDLNMLGGVAFTFGIVVIYCFTTNHVTSLDELSSLGSVGNSFLALPVVLFIIAGLTKSAQFPFQSWLLGAMVAPTPVSALLHSSTMVNAGVYLILRMAPLMAGTITGTMTAIAGGFTFMSASTLAISQSNGKKVLAYSTIANLGLIVCLAGMGTHASVAAGMFLMIFHAVSKGMLFLAVGTIEQKIGSRDIEDMQGMLKVMPFTTAILSAGMVSMLLPPFGVLISKWIAIECAVEFPLVLLFIVIGSAMTVVFWAKWLGIVSTSSYKKRRPTETVLPTTRFVLCFMLALVILCSVLIEPIYQFIIKPGVPHMFNLYSPGFVMNDVYGGVALFDRSGATVGSFGVIPFFILMLVLVLIFPIFLFKLKPNEARPPYTGGELTNNDIRGIDFIGPGEVVEKVVVRNYYFGNIFSERVLGLPLTLTGIFILLIMLGAVI